MQTEGESLQIAARWQNTRRVAGRAAVLVLLGMSAGLLVATSAAAAAAAVKPAPHRVDVKLVGGRVSNGSETFTVRQGEEAELHITSDKPIMLHLHGYELHAHVSPGKDNVLLFKATMAGRFPVHEHREGAGNHRAVFFVEVQP